MDNKKPTMETKVTRQAMPMCDKIWYLLSALNFLSAFSFSVKFMFFVPTPSGIFYGLSAYICAFGFAMMPNMK